MMKSYETLSFEKELKDMGMISLENRNGYGAMAVSSNTIFFWKKETNIWENSDGEPALMLSGQENWVHSTS